MVTIAPLSPTPHGNSALEIIPNRLYWISDKVPPKSRSHAFYFCIDNDLVYEPFFADFGPLDLGKMHLFCKELEKLLSDSQYKDFKIYHYCSTEFGKQANAALLMGSFMIICLNKSAEEAWKIFLPYQSKFVPFRDATMSVCTYKCTIYDCLKGLEIGLHLGWYNYQRFDV
jgi:cell division cycle 14